MIAFIIILIILFVVFGQSIQLLKDMTPGLKRGEVKEWVALLIGIGVGILIYNILTT